MMSLTRIILKAEFFEMHDQAGILKKHIATVLLNCKLEFLNSQINGVVFMLQRTLRIIPLVSELMKSAIAMNVTQKLKSVQTFEKVIVDTMRLRKIYLIYYFLIT